MASFGQAVSHESSEIPSNNKDKSVRRGYKASTLIGEYSSLDVVLDNFLPMVHSNFDFQVFNENVAQVCRSAA